jgi:hypothetical protein
MIAVTIWNQMLTISRVDREPPKGQSRSNYPDAPVPGHLFPGEGPAKNFT